MCLIYIADFPTKNETIHALLLDKSMITQFILTCFKVAMQLDNRRLKKGMGI